MAATTGYKENLPAEGGDETGTRVLGNQEEEAQVWQRGSGPEAGQGVVEDGNKAQDVNQDGGIKTLEEFLEEFEEGEERAMALRLYRDLRDSDDTEEDEPRQAQWEGKPNRLESRQMDDDNEGR